MVTNSPPTFAAIDRCTCGRTWPRQRHQLPERLRHHYPPEGWVWAAAKLDPCEGCRDERAALDDHVRVERRQKAAGLAERDRVWRLDRAHHVQGTLASDQVQGARRKAGPGVLVIDDAVRTAFNLMSTWQPTRGKCWVYLHGEPGTGKTALVSALVTRLISGGSDRWQYRNPNDEIDPTAYHDLPEGSTAEDANEYARHGAVIRLSRVPSVEGVVFTTEDDLWARVQLSWTQDKDPLGQVERAKVLVLDDLGSVSARDGAKKSVEAIQKLVPARYADNAPTVITSNVPWAELASVYGARVATRLADITPKDNRITLTTRWRAA